MMIGAFAGFLLLLYQGLFVPDLLEKKMVVSNWGMEKGLPQSSVNDIIQTRDGYLWLATYGGLVRFDGNSFTTFDRSNTPGIHSDRIMHLYEDSNDNIWLSTEEGFTRFGREGSSTFYFREGTFVQSPSSVVEDKHNNLWVMVLNKPHILRENTFDVVETVEDSELRSEALADSMSVWLMGERILYRTLGEKVIQVLDLSSELNHNIDDFVEFPEGSGTYYFGSTDEGVIRYKDEELTFFGVESGLPSRYTWKIYPDKNQNLWVISYDGLSFWNGNGFTPYSPFEEMNNLQIQSVIEDKEGNIWMGSNTQGLYRLRSTIIQTIDHEEGLVYESMLSLSTLNDGTIVFATNCGGIYEWNESRAFPSAINAYLPNQCVWSVFQDSQDRIWIGSRELYRTSSLQQSGVLVDETSGFSGKEIFAITEDRKGRIWIGAYNGVFVYDGESFTSYSSLDGLSYDDTRVFFEDEHETMWVGTSSGLNTISEGVIKQIPLLPVSEGGQQPYVRAIHKDEDGVMWFGTYGHGLFRLYDDELTQIRQSDGLFDNIVSHIVEDSMGYFWMGSNRGISRVSRQELNAYAEGELQIVNTFVYGVADGMKSAETNGGFYPNVIQSDDGKLYFPTVEGVVVVNTNDIEYGEVPAPVYIEQLRTHDAILPLTDQINLDYDTPYLEIGYTAISFLSPEKTRFRYMLIGFDDTWIDVGNQRSALYSKIPPGEYTFQVQARNSNGVWNLEDASIGVNVIPPFWQTKWFFALLALGFLITGPSLYYKRVNKLEKENQAKKRFTEQLIESQENERKRIAAELHDSLGQQILVIKNRAELAQLQHKSGGAEELATQLREIIHAAQASIGSVRTISHALRPVHLEKFGLTEAVEGLCSDLKLNSSIQWATQIEDIDDLIPEEKEINFYRVLQEGTTNVQRHSNATEASLIVKVRKSAIFVEIKDNGIGFNIEEIAKNKGLGFIGMQERVQNLNGSIEYRSEPGMGTRLQINIPV